MVEEAAVEAAVVAAVLAEVEAEVAAVVAPTVELAGGTKVELTAKLGNPQK